MNLVGQAQLEDLFRREYGRILAAVIAQVRDFALAEDAVQEAWMQALEAWPRRGYPDNPGAWLTTVAKRRAIDQLRRRAAAARREAQLMDTPPEDEAHPEDEMSLFPDDRLKLMFTCCHPALGIEAQVALTLRTLGGLTTAEIARAFMLPLPTMAQRLVRAQQKIQAANIPYRIPPPEKLPERLEALLRVIYLIFNEGYASTSGQALTRGDLCDEALRLGRVLLDLLPADTPQPAYNEAGGLLALMLLHDSRRAARSGPGGELITLEGQNRALWDGVKIREGVALLEKLLPQGHLGPYQLQAAISAVHAEAPQAAATDWPQIAALYGLLTAIDPSPVAALNRAVAVGMAEGAPAGLRLLYPLKKSLGDYHPYFAALGALLAADGQREAATEAYERAVALCRNPAEGDYLRGQLKRLV
jgi:RNA polymerase sigma-70 factor (ECF subfamily)